MGIAGHITPLSTCLSCAAVWAALASSAVSCSAPQERKETDRRDKGAAQIQKGAKQVQQGAEDMARGIADIARSFNGLGGSDSGAKSVEPVSFRDLQNMMPDIGHGWQRGKPTGERMSSPVTYAQAAVTYRKGDASIEEKIVDSGFSQLLLAPYSVFLTMGYEKETEEGYERAIRIRDNPGWEKWNSRRKEGELNVLVNKRFVVQVQGRGIDDPAILHDVLDQTNLRKLAAMQ